MVWWLGFGASWVRSLVWKLRSPEKLLHTVAKLKKKLLKGTRKRGTRPKREQTSPMNHACLPICLVFLYFLLFEHFTKQCINI